MHRTTLMLDEGLWKLLRRQAAEQGTTVTHIVSQAVNLFFKSPERKSKPTKLRWKTEPMGLQTDLHHRDRMYELISRRF